MKRYWTKFNKAICNLRRLRQTRTGILIEENAKRSLNSVPSGFMALDRVTGGWQLADLIVIAARPLIGKTAFATSMTRNIAVNHKLDVAFFSLEMPAQLLMTRLVIAESGISYNELRSGKLTDEQWRHIESTIKPLDSAPLFIDDTPALSVLEFRKKARQMTIRHDIKIIIIDYLQLMTGNAETRNSSRVQEMDFILRTLKSVARELNVPIIVFSQLSKIIKEGRPKRPQLSDLIESGITEQNADVVVLIHRPECYRIKEDENGIPTDGMAEFIIAKRHNSDADTVKLRFIKERVCFADIDDTILHIPA